MLDRLRPRNLGPSSALLLAAAGLLVIVLGRLLGSVVEIFGAIVVLVGALAFAWGIVFTITGGFSYLVGAVLATVDVLRRVFGHGPRDEGETDDETGDED